MTKGSIICPNCNAAGTPFVTPRDFTVKASAVSSHASWSLWTIHNHNLPLDFWYKKQPSSCPRYMPLQGNILGSPRPRGCVTVYTQLPTTLDHGNSPLEAQCRAKPPVYHICRWDAPHPQSFVRCHGVREDQQPPFPRHLNHLASPLGSTE